MIILKQPIITEKSMKLARENFYTFEVDKNVVVSKVTVVSAGEEGILLKIEPPNHAGNILQESKLMKKCLQLKMQNYLVGPKRN